MGSKFSIIVGHVTSCVIIPGNISSTPVPSQDIQDLITLGAHLIYSELLQKVKESSQIVGLNRSSAIHHGQ